MASDVKFKTVLDALQSTPLSNEVHQASDSPVIVNGPMVIDSGDAILIKGPQSVELEAFTLFLSLSLTKEGDLFSGFCDATVLRLQPGAVVAQLAQKYVIEITYGYT
jgi:hypothetical protein